jgi:hypothetical protein
VRRLTPTLRCQPAEEFLAQSRPLHGGTLIFDVGFRGIHNRFFDREMWAHGRCNGLQLIARGVSGTVQRGESEASRTRRGGVMVITSARKPAEKGSPVSVSPGTSSCLGDILDTRLFVKKGPFHANYPNACRVSNRRHLPSPTLQLIANSGPASGLMLRCRPQS